MRRQVFKGRPLRPSQVRMARRIVRMAAEQDQPLDVPLSELRLYARTFSRAGR